MRWAPTVPQAALAVWFVIAAAAGATVVAQLVGIGLLGTLAIDVIMRVGREP